jgi:sugar phosphate permease
MKDRGIIRIDPDCLLIISQRPIRIAFAAPGVAAIAIGLSVFRRALNRPIEIGDDPVEIVTRTGVDRLGRGLDRGDTDAEFGLIRIAS